MNIFPKNYNLNENVNTIMLIMFILVLFVVGIFGCCGHQNKVVENTKDSIHAQKIQMPVIVETQNIYTDTLHTK